MSNCGYLAPTGHALPLLSTAGHDRDLLEKRFSSSTVINGARTIRVRRQHNIYTCGDNDKAIYWIQRGHVKLVMSSREGKECILDVYAAGNFFGESCLAGLESRVETATAMENVVLKSVACKLFMAELDSAALSAFIREINKRNVEKQLFIADMVTMGSELRLGRALLRLGSRLGKRQQSGTLIDCRISQEELSRMVGTTRPRITEFLTRFRKLGLIQLNTERQIILKEARLTSYLSSIA